MGFSLGWWVSEERFDHSDQLQSLKQHSVNTEHQLGSKLARAVVKKKYEVVKTCCKNRRFY